MVGNITEKDVELLNDPTGINLAKLAVSYSDGIILGSEGVNEEVKAFCKESGLPILDYNADAIADGSYIEDYNSFYNQL